MFACHMPGPDGLGLHDGRRSLTRHLLHWPNTRPSTQLPRISPDRDAVEMEMEEHRREAGRQCGVGVPLVFPARAKVVEVMHLRLV